LLANNLRHLAEQDIEVAHTLFDVPDLLLALNNQGLLEVDLVLVGELGLLDLLLLLKLFKRGARGVGAPEITLLCRTSSCDRCLLLL
jgi:hypothetical protein